LADQILFEEKDISCPHLSQIVGNADPDDPSSDDHDISRLLHFVSFSEITSVKNSLFAAQNPAGILE